ncbi:Cyclic di-GMP phosphodiesterase Gmr [Fundidesulfovibrio magnetotacticus]|uniref:Cyclic di-GMP phosphodiesterase Gmr n=1 Tax=Fundidesulfovibrio magnetotacticus TaxID=2730080 RepID=A0A6V8LUA7_9BACT|nr:EAL domain-containing protein [Fundidesulfovibrio magnetotacticus]GFK96052.1 Cyclic di-GMP phosphodiesterase Gmr [Fundidesulfovibrio magnetotacticus]
MIHDPVATVLTIDDEEVIRRSFQAYLEDSGFTVLQAQNGRIGLEVFRESHPDIILVDLRMPEMDGLEVLARVVREAPEVPIIVVSGTGMIQDAIEALRLGAWDYILKPVEDLGILEHSVRRALERAKLLKENKAYRENLENLVRRRTVELHDRTRQLEEANSKLQSEIEERKAAEAKFRSIFENAIEGIFQVDHQGQLVSANPAMARILGWNSVEELLAAKVGFGSLFLDDPGNREKFFRVLDDHFAVQAFETQIMRQDGQLRWGSVNAHTVSGKTGESIRFEGTLEDISDHKRFEEQLLHQSLHDALTGLPNRALFTDRLSQAISRCARHNSFFSLLYLDVDRFKVINDSLGHASGDQFLVLLAERLRSCTREADTLARLGGDEFAVISEQVRSLSGATLVAERILEEMRKPFTIDGREIYSTVSIGIICCSGYCGTAEEVLRDADLTMYRAKSNGKARFEVFDNALHEETIKLLTMETEFRHALARQEFELHYQPIVDVNNGETISLEALLRWKHPTRGYIPPLEFIPLAEENGLIVDLGWWVLEEACRQLSLFQKRFPKQNPLSMSVNISAKQFSQADLSGKLAALLGQSDIIPGTLELEITESVIMDQGAAAIGRLEELKDLGVKLYVDDFGTGYSSLSYLHRFPIDILKIDRSFIREIDATGGHAEIVRAIVGLGRNLGMALIAEGVETEAQLAVIRTLGCQFAQGYLYSRPLPAADIEAYIATKG